MRSAGRTRSTGRHARGQSRHVQRMAQRTRAQQAKRRQRRQRRQRRRHQRRRYPNVCASSQIATQSGHDQSTTRDSNPWGCADGEFSPKCVGIAAALTLGLPGMVLVIIGVTGLLPLPVMVMGCLILGVGIIFTTVAFVLHVRQKKQRAESYSSDSEAGDTTASSISQPVAAPVTCTTTVLSAEQASQAHNSSSTSRSQAGDKSQSSVLAQPTGPRLTSSPYDSMSTTSGGQPPPARYPSASSINSRNHPPPIFGIQTFSASAVQLSETPRGPIAQSSPVVHHANLDVSFPSDSSIDPVFRAQPPSYDQLYPRGAYSLHPGGNVNQGFVHNVSLPSYHSTSN